ncbi:hypothetical protein JD969_03700 [Planctomycetota bacterium]|nr:hypothetical protein JD969_17800 [Planctomycetota bacterium]QQE12583.1 hypothetical protein JD969_03700 [Planctomycetota bacterium]
MKQQVNRRGFVLVLVLVLLTIAGVSLSMIARRSHAQTMKVVETEDVLQRKWLERSCEKYVLQQAAVILDRNLLVSDEVESEEEANQRLDVMQPIASQHMVIDLKKRQLQIVLSNEDAKANVNTLLSLYPREKVQKWLRDVMSDDRHMMTKIKLRLPREYRGLRHEEEDQSEQDSSETTNQLQPVRSYEQMYDGFKPELLLERQWLTCWSDGLLDYRTASKQALSVMLEHELGMNRIEKLVSLREEEPELELSRVLTQLDVNRSQREYIGKVMTDRSTSCYGMMLGISDRRRQYVTWTVSKLEPMERVALDGESQDQKIKLKRFAW